MANAYFDQVKRAMDMNEVFGDTPGMQWTFELLRTMPWYHLGLGDVRLSIGMQEDVVKKIEELRELCREAYAESSGYCADISADGVTCGKCFACRLRNAANGGRP